MSPHIVPSLFCVAADTPHPAENRAQQAETRYAARMHHTYLEKRDPARNQARYYRLELLPNLFGEWTLARSWGRIGRNGQTRLDWYQTRHQAQDAMRTLEYAKQRRGYFLHPEQLPLF